MKVPPAEPVAGGASGNRSPLKLGNLQQELVARDGRNGAGGYCGVAVLGMAKAHAKEADTGGPTSFWKSRAEARQSISFLLAPLAVVWSGRGTARVPKVGAASAGSRGRAAKAKRRAASIRQGSLPMGTQYHCLQMSAHFADGQRGG
jgi:hypothetical protein